MNKNDNMILETFIRLTSRTYPYGTEDDLVNSMIEQGVFPSDLQKDTHGNYFYKIGESRTIFASHLDTVSKESTTVTHIFDDYMIGTDGKTTLGADDKAGVTVMLHLMKNNIPGLYYFFIGEEVGCIGSGKLAQNWVNSEFSYTISKVVSFDRRSTCSVITHQWYGRCCSDAFAEELSFRLNGTGQRLKLEPDDTGVLTDSAQFMDIVPECTNISVGYMYEHTTGEYQDIDYLQRLCKAVCLIDWETLPVERNPYEDENDFEDDFEDDDLFETNDEGYSEEFYSYFSVDGKTKKMYIAIDLIKKETELIKNCLIHNGYSDKYDITWNGHKCYAQNETGCYDFVGSRTDLMEMITELCSVPLNKIKDKLNKVPKDISHLVF